MTNNTSFADGAIQELDMNALDLVAGGAGQTWTCTVTVKPNVTVTRCTNSQGGSIVRWDYRNGISL